MKAKLTPNDVAQLRITNKPVINPTGKIVKWEPRTERDPYSVIDLDGPTGFKVRVSKGYAGRDGSVLEDPIGQKLFLIEARIRGVVRKIRIGTTKDYSLEDARAKARSIIQDLEDGKRLPLPEDEDLKATVEGMTVGQAFDRYLAHMEKRKDRRIKEGSLNAIKDAKSRLARKEVGLANLRILDLRPERVLDAWDSVRKTSRDQSNHLKALDKKPKSSWTVSDKAKYETAGLSSVEQTFRWAKAAVAYIIDWEAENASAERRTPILTYNPFSVVQREKRFRSKAMLERDYEAKNVRNPLASDDESLKSFLEALWTHRKLQGELNRTATDYLLLTLLWGARRSESACLQWKEFVPQDELKTTSWVCLETKKVFFADTKNGRNHILPIGPVAEKILLQRKDIDFYKDDRKKWVFPARSSRAKAGHYVDSKAILKGVRTTANLDCLRTHDLRRTFGRFAEELLSGRMVKALLNHAGGDVSDRYTEPEWRRVADGVALIENAILSVAPKVKEEIVSGAG